MTHVQTVSIDAEINVNVSCRMEKDHYGVPGSPVWLTDVDHDWSDDTIDIYGVKVKIKELPEALRNAIWNEAVELVDFDSWEAVE